MRKLIILLIPLAFFSCKHKEKEEKIVEIQTKMDTISYILGTDIGKKFAEQKIDIVPKALFRGIHEGYYRTDTLISDSLKIALFNAFRMELESKREAKLKKLIAENKKKGEAFLGNNAKNEGVLSFPSGLQYFVHREGKGRNPKITDSISVHYRLSYPDGSLIFETYDKVPEGWQIDKQIDGLQEGLVLMKPGAIYDFFVPANLAYGDSSIVDDKTGNLKIPGGSTLIYHVEFIKTFWKRPSYMEVPASTPAVTDTTAN